MRLGTVSMNPHSSPKPAVSWVTLVLAAFLIFRGTSRAIGGSFGIWTWLCLGLGIFWIAQEMIRWWRFRSSEAAAPQVPSPPAAEPSAVPSAEDPLRSLVFLLDAPRDAADKTWTRHLGQVLGVEFSEDDDATGFIVPMPHPVNAHGGECFMVSVPDGIFWILNGKTPYMDDPASCAKRLKDRRLQDAVTEHRAWISVDLLRWHDEAADPAAAYDVIGKAMAALAGPDVLAVFAPEINRLNVFDAGILPVLSGGTPLKLFEDPTFSPVLGAADDDEQMDAAIAEARNRWPEFVAHFQKRDPSDGSPCLVKAPFNCDGETEHMWLDVTEIEESTVHGILANHPHRLTNVHQGQRVSVPVATLSDWLCATDANEPLGGWTQKVLARNLRGNGG